MDVIAVSSVGKDVPAAGTHQVDPRQPHLRWTAVAERDDLFGERSAWFARRSDLLAIYGVEVRSSAFPVVAHPIGPGHELAVARLEHRDADPMALGDPCQEIDDPLVDAAVDEVLAAGRTERDVGVVEHGPGVS